ncbi:MAG TPA: hypothetical protein VJM79_04725 [Rhizorhapis sp.]|nr:hypothetical protein [Rhizorhapis sp.]
MPTLGLIACSKSKGRHASLALLLYKGALFQKSMALARRTHDAVAILSAKHGLVDLDETIAPYEMTLNNMPKADRQAWAARTRAQILARYPGYDLIYYAGENYCDGLPQGKQPMARMPLGVRLQWLDRQLKGKSDAQKDDRRPVRRVSCLSAAAGRSISK